MTYAQCTPGPWDYSVEPVNQHYIRDAEGKAVAQIAGREDGINNAAALPIQEANARLIAAAPDMLEALQNLMNGIETGAITSDCDETFANAITQARAALTKATLEAPIATAPTPTTVTPELLAHNALTEALAYIQDQLGITAGDFAGVYFSDGVDEKVMLEILERYAAEEIENVEREREEAMEEAEIEAEFRRSIAEIDHQTEDQSTKARSPA